MTSMASGGPTGCGARDPPETTPKIHGEKQIRSKSDKETQAKEQKIADAKDKAQLSATGSLSLTLIVVLKKIIEDLLGGATDPMLYISLVLVSLCIIFQVIIAFVSIHIFSLKSESLAANQTVLSTVPPSRSADYSERIFRSSSDPDLSLSGEKDSKNLDERSITSQIFRLFRDLDSSDSEQPWYAACCPSMKLSQLYVDEQYSLNEASKRLYEILTIEKFKATMEYAEAEVNASKFGELDVTIPDVTDSATGVSTQNVVQAALELKWRRLHTLTTQHKLLELQLEVQQRQKHYEKLFNFQQRLTYLTYVVFIMNSFVTGFGFAGGIGASNTGEDS